MGRVTDSRASSKLTPVLRARFRIEVQWSTGAAAGKEFALTSTANAFVPRR